MKNEYYGISANSIEEALNIATSHSMYKEMKLMIKDGVNIDGIEQYRPLSTAVRLALKKSVKLLIDNGATIDLLDEDSLTPLLRACLCGGKKGSEIAIKLIESGANVNYVRQSDGMTALKFACKNCDPEVIKTLLEKGAEIDGPRDTNQTALMLAARANHLEAIQLLYDYGADLNIKSKLKWAHGADAEEIARMEEKYHAAQLLNQLKNNRPKNFFRRLFNI